MHNSSNSIFQAINHTISKTVGFSDYGVKRLNSLALRFQNDMEIYQTDKDWTLCTYSKDELISKFCSEKPELAFLDSKYVYPSMHAHECAFMNSQETEKIEKYVEEADGFVAHHFERLERSFNPLKNDEDTALMRMASRVCPVFYNYRMEQRKLIKFSKTLNGFPNQANMKIQVR